MSKQKLTSFDADSVEIYDIDGEAEVIIRVSDSEDPVVLYLDLVDWVRELLRAHPDVRLSETDRGAER